MDEKTLKLEIEDGAEILAELERQEREFNERVFAARPGWAAQAVASPEPEAPVEDHVVPDYHDYGEPGAEPQKAVGPMKTVRLSDVRISPVDWLWQGRIPRGMITLVEGDPGVGKSTFVADIVARHSTGRPFPGSTLPRTPEKALWLTLEDSLEHTLKPRIVAAGGDPSMVEAHLGVPILARSGKPDVENISSLRETIKATGATLMVIDPGAATVEDANSEAIVRQAMGELFKVGQEEGVTTIWIRHLVKNRSDRTALMSGGGSIGLAAAARSILQVLIDRAKKDSGAEFDRVVVQPKNNLDKEAPPFYFGLLDSEVVEDFTTVKVARAAWAYEPEHGVDHYDILEAIARYSAREKSSEKRAAAEWESVLYSEFESNGWRLTPKQMAAALSRAGKSAQKVKDLGTPGREWLKAHDVGWDSAAGVHVMHRPSAEPE